MRIVSAFESVFVRSAGTKGAHYEKLLIPKAVLIEFGVDYDEVEGGAGTFSTAIIELPDGTVKNLPVQNITFTNPAIKK